MRGYFLVKDELVSELNRYTRMGTFICDNGQQLKLFDASLMHASHTMLTISGFERGDRNGIDIDFAQTWVLKECEGTEPQGTMGPPFAR